MGKESLSEKTLTEMAAGRKAIEQIGTTERLEMQRGVRSMNDITLVKRWPNTQNNPLYAAMILQEMMRRAEKKSSFAMPDVDELDPDVATALMELVGYDSQE